MGAQPEDGFGSWLEKLIGGGAGVVAGPSRGERTSGPLHQLLMRR
jgi:hypothetical protein